MSATQLDLLHVPEHLSPNEIARRKDDADFKSFKVAKKIYTHRCDTDGDSFDWSAWYGVECPLDFCADHVTPDGIEVSYPQQGDCFGYGDTEKEAVEDLLSTCPHLGHWRVKEGV
jgi:hypothetical protein